MVVVKGKKLLLNKWNRLMPPTQHQDRILRVNAAYGYVEAPSFTPPQAKAMVFNEESSDEEVAPPVGSSGNGAVVEVIDVVDLMKDLEDAELRDHHSKVDDGKRENVGAALCFIGSDKVEESDKISRSHEFGRVGVSKHSMSPFAEVNISNFHQLTPFGPNHIRISKELVGANPYELSPKTRYEDGAGGFKNPLLAFEGRCPPGGSNSVIFYMTSLRGIPKTYENCCSIRYILDSFGVKYYARDVSMHTAYKEELRCILSGANTVTVPPKLFIKGRYIGGTAEVMNLHGQCKLRPLLEGIPMDEGQGHCNRCKGIGFVLCSKCNGSRRIIAATAGSWTQCQVCNENGLTICPSCS
ncbi:hypothetical protein MLD38_011269 [Melastoma candidum]|uniref:Uncharacterized protein n=1 Tax=Melastoma candidum TaxID=119954 RepID=A0ACB9R256_9MYRT|nr:hypothetical protein MLD38_011269 [Melastoma candidum]